MGPSPPGSLDRSRTVSKNPAAEERPAVLRPWKVLGRQVLLERKPWLEVSQERVELPSGRVIDDFYRVVLPDFAVIVPVTRSGEFVLVRGYKHGLGRVTLSPPAGL